MVEKLVKRKEKLSHAPEDGKTPDKTVSDIELIRMMGDNIKWEKRSGD
jgi:hypothetical protein